MNTGVAKPPSATAASGVADTSGAPASDVGVDESLDVDASFGVDASAEGVPVLSSPHAAMIAANETNDKANHWMLRTGTGR
jgi:hypothetical protein